MSFERDIVGQIPLGEAAAFFLKLKTAATPYEPPDETGALEGQFDVPPEQVLQLLPQMIQNEFKTMYAYKAYAQSLRDLTHFALAEQFEEHAEDELEHADFLMRRLAVLGGPTELPEIPAPPAATEATEILHTLIRMEQEGISAWRIFHSMLGENPSKYKVEEYIAKEQEHLDDLWQMLPHEVQQPMTSPPPQTMAMSTQPQRTPANAPNASGAGVAPATEMSAKQSSVKEAMVKMAEHVRVMRKRGSGNFDQPGDATAMMEDFLKSASARMHEKAAGIGGAHDWRPMGAIPGTAGDMQQGVQNQQPLQVQLPAIGSYTGKETTKTDLSSPAPRRSSGGGGGGGGGADDMGLGDLGLGKMGSADRGKERAETALAARARQTQGMRGELYGDVIGRILGATGGFYAGKPGGSLPAIASAALGQHLGGKTGKTVGREVDTRRNKKLAHIKAAFEDSMNMLGQEAMLQQQQANNEQGFYMERARALAAQQQQMQQALEAAEQAKEQQAQQLQQLQEAMQQQTQMSNDATTRALMQTVQANNSALQSRQLANETSSSLQQLKQTLRELAGDSGMGGEPATGPQQQGPAAQAQIGRARV